MTPLKTGTLCVALAGGRLALYAQPAALQQLQNDQITRQLQASLFGLTLGTNAPELYSGENLDVGPQRILRILPPHTYFDALFDSQTFFTDNANYAQQPFAVSSWVFVNTVDAAVTPPSIALGAGKLAVAAGLASQWYNYADNRIEALECVLKIKNGLIFWGI